jgi:[ribosomal protein S5]-alanine N-acetyltransferase
MANDPSRPSDLRIRLVIPDLALLDAAIAGSAALGPALGGAVAEGWEVFPGSIERTRRIVAADPGSTRWGARMFVLDEPRTLVGWGGFKGPPQQGEVELGYAVAPAWQGRGIATVAVREMLREAAADRAVRSVIAHTRPEPGPSVRVLEKAGFASEGEVPDQSIGTAWRFRLELSRE